MDNKEALEIANEIIRGAVLDGARLITKPMLSGQPSLMYDNKLGCVCLWINSSGGGEVINLYEASNRKCIPIYNQDLLVDFVVRVAEGSDIRYFDVYATKEQIKFHLDRKEELDEDVLTVLRKAFHFKKFTIDFESANLTLDL